MRVVIVVLAAFVLLAGVAVGQRINKVQEIVEDQQEVLSEENGEGSYNNTPPSPTESDFDNDVDVETTPIPTPKPTSARNQVSFNLASYKYPDSTVIAASETSLSTQTTDNPDTITQWYKEKINSEGMNVKSFVTTKTNDNVLNKLVGASSTKEVRVEIKKNAGEQTVQIEVSLAR